jgi:cell shape-determining protein MreC
LRDELDDLRLYVKSLEKDYQEERENNDKLERRCDELEEENIKTNQHCQSLEEENKDLKKELNKYNVISEYEKMKFELIKLTDNHTFDINKIINEDKYKEKLKLLFNCEGHELRKRYWFLQKNRTKICHPYNY